MVSLTLGTVEPDGSGRTDAVAFPWWFMVLYKPPMSASQKMVINNIRETT
jgi:hypothetical protein